MPSNRPNNRRGGRFVVASRPPSEFPKLLYHQISGQAFRVMNAEEEARLGEGWGTLQSDVRYPARSKPTVLGFEQPQPPQTLMTEEDPVSDFQEYPKAVYHPQTKELFIAENEHQEADKLEEWGVDAPQIPLGKKPADSE